MPLEDFNKLIDYFRSNRFSEAKILATSLSKRFPDNPIIWKILGVLYSYYGSHIKALNSNLIAKRLAPDDEEVLNNLANTYKELGRFSDSEKCFKKSLKVNSNFVIGYFNLGILFKDLGRLDEALTMFERTVELKPNYAEAHRHLASVKSYKSKDIQFLKMLEEFKNNRNSDELKYHLGFALGKALGDLGDYSNSYKYYKQANILRKKTLNYDFNKDKLVFEEVKKSHNALAKNTLKHQIRKEDIQPIFIVGMPRSGTTLIEQIISSHSRVEGCGELPFVSKFGNHLARGLLNISQDSITTFREKYLSKIIKLSNNRKFITDKMPHNFLYIALILSAFPNSKIINVQRNPAAICWSNYSNFFARESLGYSFSLDDVIEFFKLYSNLMKSWINYYPYNILNVNYDLLTKNPEKETIDLINFLDLDWDEKCLQPQNNQRIVSTTSNVQVRKKIFQGSSNFWRNYLPYLDDKLDHLDFYYDA